MTEHPAAIEVALRQYCEMTGADPDDVTVEFHGDEIVFVKGGERTPLVEFEEDSE